MSSLWHVIDIHTHTHMHKHSFTHMLTPLLQWLLALIIIFKYSDFPSHILAGGDVVAVFRVSFHLCFCRCSWISCIWPQCAFFSLHRCSSWLPGFWLLVSIFSSSLLSSLFIPPLSLISPFKYYYGRKDGKKEQWCCRLWWEHWHRGLWLCWCLCLWVPTKKKR